MGVTVQNITGSTALVIWPKMAGCVDSFYSIMYNPNWDKMLSGYTRKHFQKEERVPASRSSFLIENLIPLTTYILCVTCQSANPSSDQCRIFNTPEQDPASKSNKKKDIAVGIWLTSTVLLLIIVGILVYSCLHIWCNLSCFWSERIGRLQGRCPGDAQMFYHPYGRLLSCPRMELELIEGAHPRSLQVGFKPGSFQISNPTFKSQGFYLD
uniref:Fibronectin type-III domain-containing protein n=1 Tax=Anolis carolinensis TaxID=28377 RepID=G1KML4_ANOCA